MAGVSNLYRRHAMQGMSDEEAVVQARQGSRRATEYLLRKYRHLVEGKAKTYFVLGADHEDVVQEGMIGLFKAIRDFSTENLSAFRSFAELCITRQIITAVKTASRQKHALLNSYVSMECPIADLEDDPPLGEAIIENRPCDPQVLFLSHEFEHEVEGQMRSRLSPLEAAVLHRYIECKSYGDIAGELCRNVKQVDNALQRAKKKMGRSLRAALAGR